MYEIIGALNIAVLTLSVLLLATPGYPDSPAPPTAEDIAYMTQTLSDAGAGCYVFPNPDVPGGYMTRGVIEEEEGEVDSYLRVYPPGPRYCVDVDVFNVGSCYEPSYFGYRPRSPFPRRLTVSVPFPPANHYWVVNMDSAIVIHYPSTADDVEIRLERLWAAFVIGVDYHTHAPDAHDAMLQVWVKQNENESRYAIIYYPATATIGDIDIDTPDAIPPEIVDVIREPLREFFARLTSIVTDGMIPDAQPPVPCPEE